jgi:hypothetical protein
MEPTVSIRASLLFQTNSGRPSSFSVPHANAAKPADDARATMNRMLDIGILRLHNGTPTAAKSASIVTTTTTFII